MEGVLKTGSIFEQFQENSKSNRVPLRCVPMLSDQYSRMRHVALLQGSPHSLHQENSARCIGSGGTDKSISFSYWCERRRVIETNKTVPVFLLKACGTYSREKEKQFLHHESFYIVGTRVNAILQRIFEKRKKNE